MRAAVCHHTGGAPIYGSFNEPDAAKGEVVEVVAAAIKQLDRAIVAGTHYSSPRDFPYIPGTDGVARTRNGLAYFAAERRPFGAMAEQAEASWSVPLPPGLDPFQAAAIVNPALGAWLPLVWRGGFEIGESVMILGATGTTGRLAVAAARLLGARRVIAAGRRMHVLVDLAADAVIDLTLDAEKLRSAYAAEIEQGLDLIVDYVWGRPVEILLSALTQTGLHADSSSDKNVRLVAVGAMAGADVQLPSAALRGSRTMIIGSGTANFPPRERILAIVAEILDRSARGEIALETAVHPLDQVAKVWKQPTTDARPVLAID